MSLMRSLLRAYALQHYSVDWSKLMDTGQVSIRKEKQVATRKIMPSTGAQALSNAIQLTNDYVSKFHSELNMFATTFFGVLDPSSGSLLYINGGHCPPMLLDADGNIKARLEATGPAVGMFPDSTFEMDEVVIEEGDTLFTFTDGVTDTRNTAGKMFKEAGILPLLQPPTNSINALLERVKDNLESFKGEAVQFDDITMLGIRREPRAKS
jgi:sigma-B regulation protein RsbU (phosphoserine phosphatase)